MVSNKERPDHITTAMLNGRPDNAFLKLNMPTNKKVAPIIFTRQSAMPFDFAKHIFHTASQKADKSMSKKAQFAFMIFFADKYSADKVKRLKQQYLLLKNYLYLMAPTNHQLLQESRRW